MTATPVTAPAGLTAETDYGEVTLDRSPVGSTAAAPVDGYRVAVDGTPSATTAASEHTITGLTNDVTYTFTVTAYGPGGESGPAAVDTTPTSPELIVNGGFETGTLEPHNWNAGGSPTTGRPTRPPTPTKGTTACVTTRPGRPPPPRSRSTVRLRQGTPARMLPQRKVRSTPP